MKGRATHACFVLAGLLVGLVLVLTSGDSAAGEKKSSGKNAPSLSLRLLDKVMEGYPLPKPAFKMFEPGLPTALDYTRYGEFKGAGTADFQFIVTRPEELNKDIGAGIYPNHERVVHDPGYRKMSSGGRLEGDYWQALKDSDPRRAFYLWAGMPQEPGVSAFFTAVSLEKSGHILPAIKAYYAALVHFPKSFCWSEDHSFIWYIAPAAIAGIQRLCRDYPRLNLELTGAWAVVENGHDRDIGNDVIKVDPGTFTRRTLAQRRAALPDLGAIPVVEERGQGKVRLVRYANGHWQMLVDDRPFWVRGVSYMPTAVGLSYTSDFNYANFWLFSDVNDNGQVDAPYEAWVDKNGNGRQDKDEPAVGDFQLLKDMGINAIRWYVPTTKEGAYDPALVNKPLLRDLYHRYGIAVIAGDFLGAYTIGSGAGWEQGTDYTDPQQRKRMKDIVRAKVMDLKDEPFVLMWVLGNENNIAGDYSGVNATRTNASAYPQAYASLLNEVAQMIHEIDGNHPVAVGNMGLGLAEHYKRHAPAIDILGVNEYAGGHGFGGMWQEARKAFDRPVLVTEYGCDAFFEGRGVDETSQRLYHEGNVRDITFQQAGGPLEGNAIGGVIFEYVDEWWKAPGDPPDVQTRISQMKFPFPDGFDHEEWLGVVSQGSGKNSPFERRLRETYDFYRKFWRE